MIRLRGVRKAYADGGTRHQVLDGVDLEVEAGDFVAVVGTSGSGKSTLLNLVGGLDTDYEGEVEVDGRPLRGQGDAALSRFRNRTVGFVFQAFHLVPELSALDNVCLPDWFHPEGADDASIRRRAADVLESVGLAGKTHRRPDNLSGGERQRVAIARALLAGPKILLCDEPTGNLDEETGGEIIGLFRRLNAEGITLLMVTHEARVAGAARRVLRLVGGQLEAAAAAGSEVAKTAPAGDAAADGGGL
jgi:putative ABC transport system ATP-binding protein